MHDKGLSKTMIFPDRKTRRSFDRTENQPGSPQVPQAESSLSARYTRDIVLNSICDDVSSCTPSCTSNRMHPDYATRLLLNRNWMVKHNRPDKSQPHQQVITNSKAEMNSGRWRLINSDRFESVRCWIDIYCRHLSRPCFRLFFLRLSLSLSLSLSLLIDPLIQPVLYSASSL